VHLHGAHPLWIDPGLSTISGFIASHALTNFPLSSGILLADCCLVWMIFASCGFAKSHAPDGSTITLHPGARGLPTVSWADYFLWPLAINVAGAAAFAGNL